MDFYKDNKFFKVVPPQLSAKQHVVYIIKDLKEKSFQVPKLTVSKSQYCFSILVTFFH